MQKHLLYINTLAISSVLAFTACTDEINNAPDQQTPDSEKTAIELNVGIKGVKAPETRAITVLPSDNKYRAFENSTQLYMIYKCDDLSSESRATKYTKTIGLAGKVPSPADGSVSPIDFEREQYPTDHGKFMRYWDDAYARESALSIYAICFPGCNAYANQTTGDGILDARGINFGGSNAYASLGWNTTSLSTLVTWQLTDQNINNTGLNLIDLCYSNNISSNTTEGDKRIKFNTSTKHFETEKTMVFYHSAAKFTFIINKDTDNGFTENEAFNFATSENIKLQGFNNKVTNFDVATGELASSGTYTVGDINKLWEDTPTTSGTSVLGRTVRGLIFPETDMSVDFAEAVSFTINNNKYIISRKQLFDAIKANPANVEGDNVKEEYLTDHKKLKAGVHYIFTFNIGKTKIKSITATIANWENVTAEDITPSNAYVNVSVKTSEGDKITGSTPGFSLYRAAGATYTGPFTAAGYDAYADYTWEKGYETVPATLTETSTAGVYSTNWYWPDNNTFYHFRTLTPIGQTLEGNDANTYVAIHGGVIKEGSVTAIDYLWGAPFKTTAPTPDLYSFTSGYCNNETKANGQLYKAIGATEDNITLIQHHMTSQVFVKLETTTGSDQVDLTDATVELTNVATVANLLLGNGLITNYSSYDTIEMTYDPHAAVADPVTPAYDYSYGVLPQLLTNNTSKTVGITITAKDGNKYIIDNIQIAKFSGTDNPITKWEPGKKYYYTFRLIKTGIDKITATIVKWETVTANPDDVYIK